MKRKDCSKPVSYLDQLGIDHIDYVFISHYHFDHIGCVPEVLQQFPVRKTVFDRGNSYPGATYESYVSAVAGNVVPVGATAYTVRHGQNVTESYPIAALDGPSSTLPRIPQRHRRPALAGLRARHRDRRPTVA
jgi:Metallo-beta-lactamase superfamily